MSSWHTDNPNKAIPLEFVTETDFDAWCAKQTTPTQTWLAANNFKAAAHTHCAVPDDAGQIAKVIVGCGKAWDRWSAGALATALPPGEYALPTNLSPEQTTQAVIAWGLGAYRYTRFKACDKPIAQCVLTDDMNTTEALAIIDSVYSVRDLINAPMESLGPEALAADAALLAERYDAECEIIVGDDLIKDNYPCVHAVGRASSQAPRFIHLQKNTKSKAPTICFVGKGVCFDSGGLDLKPGRGMRLMKKDMGGAAHALGLAQLIWSLDLPVNLHVMIPAVENAVSANAYRPGDVINTRSGRTVEIDNTDAEGRLVLADALTRAQEFSPDLIIDFATLTGAARVALGTDIPVFFANDEAIASELSQAAKVRDELIWPLPLYEGYQSQLDSRIADKVNCPSSPYGGAITAALFLESFIDNTRWVHFDLMAWNTTSRPGRPEGGEAMGLQTVYSFIQNHLDAK
jgi:leucyl aminopeptidase